jgi:uncharacterized protein (TIGR03067 family)
MVRLGARVFWIFAVAAAASNGFPDEKKECTGLRGSWACKSISYGGTDVWKAVARTIELQFLREHLDIKDRYGGRWELEYMIDQAQNPMFINVTHNEDRTKKIHGIYRIDGDKLTMCFPLSPDGKRPTDFNTAAKDQIVLILEKSRKEIEEKKDTKPDKRTSEK